MQPVMFPVHASLLKYSIPEMQRLLFQVPNSSLCVWSTRANPIESIDELLAIRKSFNIGQVFYKLPDEQLECFFSNTQWTTFAIIFIRSFSLLALHQLIQTALKLSCYYLVPIVFVPLFLFTGLQLILIQKTSQEKDECFKPFPQLHSNIQCVKSAL